LRTFKNEALDIDIMHRKLNDITDKQFNLEELSATYNVKSERNSSEDAYKLHFSFKTKKSRS
jgi:DNA polymerase-3 subunit epsilon